MPILKEIRKLYFLAAELVFKRLDIFFEGVCEHKVRDCYNGS